LTCSDTTRPGQNDGVRGLLELRECSHHVQSFGVFAEKSSDTPDRGAISFAMLMAAMTELFRDERA